MRWWQAGKSSGPTPPDVSDLAFHHNGDNVVVTSGSDVDSWTDLAPGSHNAVSGGAAKATRNLAALGGKATVTFSGAGNQFYDGDNGSLVSPAGFTVAVLSKQAVSSSFTGACVDVAPTNTTTNAFMALAENGTNRMCRVFPLDATYAFNATTWALHIGTVGNTPGPNASVRIYEGTTVKNTQNAGSPFSANYRYWRLGALFQVPASWGFNGDIAAVLGWKKEQDATGRSAIVTYINAYYGTAFT